MSSLAWAGRWAIGQPRRPAIIIGEHQVNPEAEQAEGAVVEAGTAVASEARKIVLGPFAAKEKERQWWRKERAAAAERLELGVVMPAKQYAASRKREQKELIRFARQHVGDWYAAREMERMHQTLWYDAQQLMGNDEDYRQLRLVLIQRGPRHVEPTLIRLMHEALDGLPAREAVRMREVGFWPGCRLWSELIGDLPDVPRPIPPPFAPPLSIAV